MRIALVGDGRMSRAIQLLAATRGDEIVTVITGGENRGGEALTAERLDAAEVVLEFTRPAVAADNLLRLAAMGARVVSGTTGWVDRLEEIEGAVARGGGALIHSANFSIGVQLFIRAAAAVTEQFRGRLEFDEFILEAHHKRKLDAPSGTALRLQEAALEADPSRLFPISSVRAGTLPGPHSLHFDAAGETIALEHVSRGREGFAAGALAAAEWLRGLRGVYRFEQMLFGDSV